MASPSPRNPQKDLVLKLTVIRGAGLMVADLLSSDPFCVMGVTNPEAEWVSEVHKTKWIKGTVNPEWKKEHDPTKEFPITPGMLEQGVLRIELWDYERVGKNDPMGCVVIPLKRLFDQPGESTNQVVPMKKEKAKGTLTINCVWT